MIKQDYIDKILPTSLPHILQRATVKILVVPLSKNSSQNFSDLLKILKSSNVFLIEEILSLDKNVISNIYPKSQIFLSFENVLDGFAMASIDSSGFHTFSQPLAIFGLIFDDFTEGFELLRSKYESKYKDTVSSLKKKYPNILSDRCVFIQSESAALQSPDERSQSGGERFRFIINRSEEHLEACLNAEIEDLVKELVQALIALISQVERKQQQQQVINLNLWNNTPSNPLTGSVAPHVPYNELINRVNLAHNVGADHEISVLNEEIYLSRNSSASAVEPIQSEGATLDRNSSFASFPASENNPAALDDVSPVRNPSFASVSQKSQNKSSNSGGRPRTLSNGSETAPAMPNLATPLNAFNEQIKEKKKVPARCNKRLGELYLLCGCWSKALQSFANAMDVLKKLDDYVYYLSAVEGYLVSQILMKDSESINSEFYEKLDEISKLLEENIKDPWIRICLSTRISCLLTRLAVLQNDPEMKIKASQAIMKIWSSGIEELVLIDQVKIASFMSQMYGMLGYKRKEAFFSRQTALLLLPHLMERLPSILKQQEKLKKRRPVSTICEYSSKSTLLSSENIADVDGYSLNQKIPEEEEFYDLNIYRAQKEIMIRYMGNSIKLYKNDGISSRFKGKYNCFNFSYDIYWSVLYLDVLRECIKMAEITQEFGHSGYLTGLLLEDAVIYDADSDTQKKILMSICKIANKLTYKPLNYTFSSKLDKIIQKEDFDKLANTKIFDSKNHFLFDLLHRVEVYSGAKESKHDPGKVFVKLKSSVVSEVKESADQLFLYNPFSKKTNLDVERDTFVVKIDASLNYIVVDEPFIVKVHLQNPLNCELPILDLSLVIQSNFEFNVITDATPLILLPKSSATFFWVVTILPTTIRDLSEEKPDFVLHGIVTKFSNGWMEFLKTYEEVRLSILLHNPPVLKVVNSSLLRNSDVLIYDGESTLVEYFIDIVPESIKGAGSLDFIDITIDLPDKNVCYDFIASNSVNEYYFERNVYDREIKAVKVVGIFTAEDEEISFPLSLNSTVVNRVKLVLKCMGKRDFQSANVIIEYGNYSNVKQYYRKLTLPLNITVERPLEIVNIHLSKTDPISLVKKKPAIFEKSMSIDEFNFNSEENKPDVQVACIVDIRNNSSIPFYIKYTYPKTEYNSPYFGPVASYGKNDFITISPNQTKRCLIPIERISLSEIMESVKPLLKESNEYFYFNLLPYDPLMDTIPPIPLCPKVTLSNHTDQDGTSQKYSRLINDLEKKLKNGSNLDIKNLRKDFIAAYSDESFQRTSFYLKHHLFKTRLCGLQWKTSSDDSSRKREGYLPLRHLTALNSSDIIYLRKPRFNLKVDLTDEFGKTLKSRNEVHHVNYDSVVCINFTLSEECNPCLLRVQSYHETNEEEIENEETESGFIIEGKLQTILSNNTEGILSSNNHSIKFKFTAKGIYKFLYCVEDINQCLRKNLDERKQKLLGNYSFSLMEWCLEPIIFCVS